ncbi:hypothetical protein [Amycolatopsis rubida]|uniref:Short chain dehydrogenase n=1 Tax=Amycolatopsis rubida TaxID=112413 RepID=A0A1I5I0K6_9PSEU|nr:hypothetical protein [Amycolatopsis rubida]SFO54104.1 hypothetical protein SAMN05421854_102201 [Amycolatopsis rubida]
MAETFGRLDALINNAGYVVDFATLSALDVELPAVQSALDIDVLGPWQSTQLLLPSLKAAPAHSFAKHTLTGVLAPALRNTPILVNAVDPGETATHPERGDEDIARPARETARGAVWAATLPTGGLFRDSELVLSLLPGTENTAGPDRDRSEPAAGKPLVRQDQ